MELDYLNSRVRAQIGRLLRRPDYEPLLAAQSEDEYAARLAATAYGPYLSVAGARFERTEDVISGALTESLSDAIARLRKYAPPPAHALLKALFTTWEVYNLKAVIRGLARGIPREDVRRAFIPAGDFDRAALNTLLKAKDIPDMLRFLETWASPYAGPVREGVADFLRNGSINTIEIKLDLFGYALALSHLGRARGEARLIRELIALRIDIRNVVTLFNIAGQSYTAEAVDGFFIKGGTRLAESVFLELASVKDRQELIARLSDEINDKPMAAILAETEPKGAAMLEERLEAMAEKRLRRLSMVEPLSIAVAAAYLYMKVREVRNLRLLERAAAFHIPEDTVGEMLIYPV